MHLNDALARSALESTLCLHEQSVAIAAEYYGRVSNQPFGVALVTNGPGATNTLTAVAGAFIESVPLLIISGQVKSSDYCSTKKIRQTGVQEVATLGMVKGITKYATIILKPEDIRQELDECWRQLTTGRMGPVWIEVPLDVQAAVFKEEILHTKRTVEDKNELLYVSSRREEITNLLSSQAGRYQRPLLLVGQGVRHAHAVKIVNKFARKFRLPIVTTFPAKDFIEYESELFIGHPGNVSLRPGNLAVQNCDLLISIGSSLNNIVTAYNPSEFARNAHKIIFDIDIDELDKHEIPNSTMIEATPQVAVDCLEKSMIIGDGVKYDWLTYLRGLKEKYCYPDDKAFVNLNEAIQGRRLSIYQVVDRLGDLLSEYRVIVTGSSGLCIEAFYMIFRNQKDQRILIDSGLGSMGYGLPALVGACSSLPREKVILYEGDGSLQMNIQELATISGNKCSCLIIVINNNGYASIKNSQRGYFNGRLLGCDDSSGLFLPSLKELVEAYRIAYCEAWTIEQLVESIESAASINGPMLVEVFTDGDVVLQPRVKSIKTVDGTMVSLPIEDMMPLLELSELKMSMKYSSKLHRDSYKIRE